MKYKRSISIILSLLAIFPSCAGKKNDNRKPADNMQMVSVSYAYGSQMERFPSYDITVKRDGDRTLAISFDISRVTYCCYLVNMPDFFDQMQDLILQDKIYKYDNHYYDPHVLDGDWWSFSSKYQDPADPKKYQIINSSGSNAGPKGEGLKHVGLLLSSALDNAEYLYACDKEGNQIDENSHLYDEEE